MLIIEENKKQVILLLIIIWKSAMYLMIGNDNKQQHIKGAFL